MDIYVFSKLDQIPSNLFWRAFAILPTDRQEKVNRLSTENRKRQSALAYLLLVSALRQYTGELWFPQLTGDGKPKIARREDLHCSMSHCERGAAAVVHHSLVGVDIESVRPYNPKVARYVCSAEEVEHIEQSDDPALTFTVLWTKKESCIKLYGESVGPNMKHLGERFNRLEFETKIGDGWVVTACCEKSED